MPTQQTNIEVVITVLTIGAILLTSVAWLWLKVRGKLYITDEPLRPSYPKPTIVPPAQRVSTLSLPEIYFQKFLHRFFQVRPVMSNEELEDDEETDEIEAEINTETTETLQPVEENRGETFSLAEIRQIQAETLARLVIKEYVNLSDAVKIGMASPTGDAYSKSTRILKAEIERQKQRYRPLPEEQEQKRVEFELVRK